VSANLFSDVFDIRVKRSAEFSTDHLSIGTKKISPNCIDDYCSFTYFDLSSFVGTKNCSRARNI